MLLVALMLSACTAMKNLLRKDAPAQPKDVTVTEALKDIGVGFSGLREALGENILGVYPCKITVSLQVKTSINEQGKGVLALSAPAEVVTAGIEAEQSRSTTSARGNTINIEMYNPGCLPKDTLGYRKPEKIVDAMKGMAVKESNPDSEKPQDHGVPDNIKAIEEQGAENEETRPPDNMYR